MIKPYLRMSFLEWAKVSFSHCNRKKVGAIIVKNGMIISDGYNGTPSGFDNCCEDENGETYWFVLHAEVHFILKKQPDLLMIVVELHYILLCLLVRIVVN